MTPVYQKLDTPCGRLYIADLGGKLFRCDWVCPTGAKEDRTPLLDETRRQIEEYFEGKRKEFNIQAEQDGSEFRQKVWTAIASIPYGETLSYSDLAARIGRPDAVRAVAGACGANKLSLIIPCHRVVGKNGKLTGYAGGIQAKEVLIELEKKTL